MKLLQRYDFTNDRSFETYLLSEADQGRLGVPECDVIGLRRVSEKDQMTVLRPDEALIVARLLIDAVHATTETYQIAS